MITVKDVNGQEANVASNGKATAGLTLGIIGTTLGALGGNVLNGVLGGNNAAAPTNGSGCTISAEKYYTDTINQLNIQNAKDMAIQKEICELKSLIAVNTTANTYQNKLVEAGFANVDNQFKTERMVTTYQIGDATCDVIRGKKTLDINQVSLPLYANNQMLMTREVAPVYAAQRTVDTFGGCDYGNYSC